MIPIELHIDHGNQRKTLRRSLPESWTDMESGLRLFCYETMVNNDRPVALVKIIQRLLDLPIAKFKAIPNQAIEDIARRLFWINLGPQTTPLVPSFLANGIEYHFPATNFQNGRANIYPLADDFFEQFMSGDESQIDLLLATLVVPLAKDGERIPIKTRSEIIRRAEQFKGVSPAIKMAALTYWAGIKEYVFDLYKGHLWPDPDEEKPETEVAEEAHEGQQEQSEGVMFGWWGVFMELAETGVFGTLDDVHQSNFHTLCMYRTKKRKEQVDAEIRNRLNK